LKPANRWTIGVGRNLVAPYTGAWIETLLRNYPLIMSVRSPLHGGVD